MNAHGVSARDVVFLLRECALGRSRVDTESQSSREFVEHLQTSERPLVETIQKMSGENEETQAAEETPVDEKVCEQPFGNEEKAGLWLTLL